MQISIGKLSQLFKYLRGKTKEKPQKKEKNENWINLFFDYTVYVQKLFLFCRVTLIFSRTEIAVEPHQSCAVLPSGRE